MEEKDIKKSVGEEYKYGFKDEDVSLINTGKGLNEAVVREISRLKNEPEWMLEFRLKAYKAFMEMDMPSFGPDLSSLDFQSYTYFIRSSKKVEKDWNEVPETIKNTFENSYHNGFIEGNNNFIKVIKRIAFGFRSFRRFKARIMICKGLLKIKKIANA